MSQILKLAKFLEKTEKSFDIIIDADCINEFVNIIKNKYDVDIDYKTFELPTKRTKKVVDSNIESKNIEFNNIVLEAGRCQHILGNKSKTNSGEQCPTRPKGGALFCSKHRKKESSPKSNSSVKSTISVKSKDIVVRKHSTLNVFHHPPTGAIIEAREVDNVKICYVVGMVKNDEIVDFLTKTDVEVLEPYSSSLICDISKIRTND